MGKLKKALEKGQVERESIEARNYIDSKNRPSKLVSRASVTVKENLTESMRDIKPIVEKRADISHHLLNQETEKIRENLIKSDMDKNDIAKKIDLFRTENSNYSSDKKKNYLFTLFKPASFISESFNIIRTLLFTLMKEKNLKTILVTSSLPMEGKSFVASNIAVSLSYGLDQRVLLVDADLRRPSLQKIFKIRMDSGLSDLLRNQNNRSRDLIQRTKIPNLSLLPAGKCNEPATKLISSDLLNTWVREMKTQHDDLYMIFDAPPAHLSEALVLSNIVDGIILVVKAGKTDKKLVKKTVDILGREKILGVVLNHCQVETKQYYKYYKNYYQYH